MIATAFHDAEVAGRFDTLVGRFKRDVSTHDYRLNAIVKALPAMRGSKVLDLGCGKGRFARQLIERGSRVIGIDISARMMVEAEGLARVKATARQLPFGDAEFDAIIAVETLEHVGDVSAVVAEARRVLRPGGRFIVIDKNAWSLDARRPWLPSLAIKWLDERRGRWMYPAGGPVRERWFGPSRMRRLLSERFTDVSTEYLLSDTEACRTVFRICPRARLMVCWTATVPGGES